MLLLSVYRIPSTRNVIWYSLRLVLAARETFLGFLFVIFYVPLAIMYFIVGALLVACAWPIVVLWLFWDALFPSLGDGLMFKAVKATMLLAPKRHRPDDEEFTLMAKEARSRRRWNDVRMLLPFIYLLVAETYNIAIAHGATLAKYLASYH